MKIRLVICSNDKQYVKHLLDYLSVHFNEKIELNAFDSKRDVEEFLKQYRADILLLDANDQWIPNCEVNVAYLAEERIENDEKITIFKYQKGELIYKAILDLYASGLNHGFSTIGKTENGMAGLHVFMPLNGGAGASTVAQAYALGMAEDKKTLYLNMEVFGNCEKVFYAEGSFDFDDILFALKSRRGNLQLKIESALRKTADGVFFYAPSKNPMNIMEMTEDEAVRLLSEIKKCGLFEEIVVDMDAFPSPWMLAGMREANNICLVADGTDISHDKCESFLRFIAALEEKGEVRYLTKMRIFYNKYSRKSGKPVAGDKLEILGGSPKYEGMTSIEIVKRIARDKLFGKQIF